MRQALSLVHINSTQDLTVEVIAGFSDRIRIGALTRLGGCSVVSVRQPRLPGGMVGFKSRRSASSGSMSSFVAGGVV